MKPILLCWLRIAFLLTSPGGGSAAVFQGHTWSDAELKQAVRDFGSGKKGIVVFQRAGLSNVLPRLVRLQQRTPETSALYRYVTFTLAFLEKDYRRNVRRLIKPIVLYEAHTRNWSDYEETGVHSPDVREEVPDLVSRLYTHNLDPALLELLCSWTLDGGPAEVLSATRNDLLVHHPLEVLKAAQHSRDIPDCIAGDAAFDLYSDKADYRQFAHKIQQATRRGSPGLRRFTRRFLRQVATLRRQLLA